MIEMPSLAVRVEPATRVEHRIEYIPSPRGRLYVCASKPPEASTCVMICSSIFGDFAANYHRERLLSEAISSSGHGAIRFHYAGEGNSHGDRRIMTFESMCEDADTVMEYAHSMGFTKFGVLGTRVGGLVAAAIVSSKRSVPLALWEPVADPLRLISEAQRARRISQMAQFIDVQTSQWRTELVERGVIDLLGYDVHPELVESLGRVDLLTILGSITRPVFIARFRGGLGERDDVAQTLIGRGFSVDVGQYGLAESWWFDRDTTVESRDLHAATTAWLSAALAARQ